MQTESRKTIKKKEQKEVKANISCILPQFSHQNRVNYPFNDRKSKTVSRGIENNFCLSSDDFDLVEF